MQPLPGPQCPAVTEERGPERGSHPPKGTEHGLEPSQASTLGGQRQEGRRTQCNCGCLLRGCGSQRWERVLVLDPGLGPISHRPREPSRWWGSHSLALELGRLLPAPPCRRAQFALVSVSAPQASSPRRPHGLPTSARKRSRREAPVSARSPGGSWDSGRGGASLTPPLLSAPPGRESELRGHRGRNLRARSTELSRASCGRPGGECLHRVSGLAGGHRD